MRRAERVELLLEGKHSAEALLALGVTPQDAEDAVSLCRLDLELTRRATVLDTCREVVADTTAFLTNFSGLGEVE